MNRSVHIAWVVALTGCVWPVRAVDFPLLGAISGVVRDNQGAAQMGASVLLLNRNERVIQRTLSDGDGRFRFPSLAPDQYSVRVLLSTFVPASREMISVRPGVESYLSIQLANLFSSIELVYLAVPQGSLLADDWKWALRSANSIRPVLRFLPELSSSSSSRRPGLYNRPTRAILSVSAGEGSALTPLGLAPDLGTAFAVATSVFGSRELTVSGNLGYASQAGAPTAGFSTRLAGSESAVSPDVELTVRQASVGAVAGGNLLRGAGETPALRTMSLKLADKASLAEDVTIEYGALFEAVSYVDRLSQFSPFARLTYDLGETGKLEVAYSSGAPAADLLLTGQDAAQDQLASLALFPRLSFYSGSTRIQRNDTFEAGLASTQGQWTYTASVFRDRVSDAAISAAAPAGFYRHSDLLPDIASSAAIFNAGSYSNFGYAAGADRRLSDQWTAGLSVGASGMLTALDPTLETHNPNELRASLRPVRRPWARARIHGVLARTGTRLSASYMWTSNGTLGPSHAWLTQRSQPLMGLNLQVRQPVPAGGLPGRLEMTAEVRNLLADGYVPVLTPDGRQIWLVQFPRALRGGFSFIF
jgi:hypothetical protein